jgi:L-threonylcarbamoyladenylate synthase
MSALTDIRTPTLAADGAGIDAAAALLRSGALVAFPTETVYGLGADATNGEAVAAIFEAKGRPQFNPLIVHVESLARARTLGVFGPLAEKLAAEFWPGPFTLVLPRTADCPASALVSAGLPTIALRIPASDTASALLHAANCPIAAPSANRSGAVSPTEAAHVLADLSGKIAGVIDGGSCSVGVESTVVGFQDETPVLLRHGGISKEEIEAVVGPIALFSDPERPHSPGQLLSHYAPRATLRLNASQVEGGEALLAFGPGAPEESASCLNLSARGDLKEAAAHLFSYLRRLDETGAATIAVMRVPETGLGAAINDRLSRAAQPGQTTRGGS